VTIDATAFAPASSGRCRDAQRCGRLPVSSASAQQKARKLRLGITLVLAPRGVT